MLKLTCDCGRDGEVTRVFEDGLPYHVCSGCRRKYVFCENRCTFVSQYPHLRMTLTIMFNDNDFDAKPVEDWLWPANVACLEEQASRLNEYEKAIIAAGECEEMVAIAEAHECWPLDSFLNQVFDGELTKDFT